jgi:hypothetical protein
LSEEDEIRAVLENIATSFLRLDIAAWLENFHSPRMILTPGACGTPVAAADAEVLLSPVVASLQERGFNRTSIDSCGVKLLTPDTAIASAVFSRYADEEVLESLGGTYFLQKGNGRWGVILVAAHGPETIVISS